MSIYVWNYISIPILAKIFKRKHFCVLAATQMFLILALRADYLGIDLITYRQAFDYISGLQFGEMLSRFRWINVAALPRPFSLESGWMFLNWMISVANLPFHALLVFCAAINMYACGTFIYKYSKTPWLSFCMIASMNTYIYMFGILRQSLSLSLVILAIDACCEKKKIRTIALWLLAFLIHRTAIISLVLFVILKWNCAEKKKYIRFFLCWIPFVLVTPFIYSSVYKIMSAFGKGYMGHGMEFNNLMILLLGFGVIVWLFLDFRNLKTAMDTVPIWGLIAAIYWETIGLYNENLARSVQYFSVHISLLVPMVLYYYPSKKVARIGKLVVFAFCFVYMIYLLNGSAIVPYRTCLV